MSDSFTDDECFEALKNAFIRSDDEFMNLMEQEVRKEQSRTKTFRVEYLWPDGSVYENSKDSKQEG